MQPGFDDIAGTEERDRAARSVGRRQSLFREVNERIEGLAERLDLSDAMPILCECGSMSCNEGIELTRTEYELLRLHPTRFAVVAGHDIPAVERVVEENERFVIVEKFGEGAAAAIEHDPRRGTRTDDGSAS